MPGGRPTDFTPELGAEICLRVMTNPINKSSLVHICKAEDMPCRRTVYNWMIKAAGNNATKSEKEFLHRYEVAQQIRLENMFEEIVEISYDDSGDLICGKDGDRGNSTAVSRHKLITDNLKWCLSKLDPDKYSDRIRQDHDVTIGAHKSLIDAIKAAKGKV